MKNKNISIIATLLVTLLMAGCTHQQEAETLYPSGFSEALRLARVSSEVEKDVELALKADEQDGVVTVQVTLENPSRRPIASVQSWLSYDPDALQGVSVDIEDTTLAISVPYEMGFDPILGIIKLGGAATQPITETSITIATLVFEKTGEGATALGTYDYQEDLSGHTSVNILVDEKPYNVLKKPVTPLLIIQN